MKNVPHHHEGKFLRDRRRFKNWLRAQEDENLDLKLRVGPAFLLVGITVDAEVQNSWVTKANVIDIAARWGLKPGGPG
jgi:hypothetical protein